MDTFEVQVIAKIISEQQAIVGPFAGDLARKIVNIHFDSEGRNVVSVEGDLKTNLKSLVTQYAQLFGQASIETCKEAVHSISPPIAPELLPDELR